jgi:hypothetical protein
MARADQSHYAVLGVDAGASTAEVRKAYLRLAREHHPDFHTNERAATRAANEREMQRISEAWQVLGDPARRRAYDERWVRADPADRSGRRASTRTARGPGPADYRFTPIDDGPDVDDAALLDDTPVAGTAVSRTAQVVPAALFLGGSAVFAVGAVVRLAELVAVGIILAVLGLVGFVLTPAMAIARSWQAERDA